MRDLYQLSVNLLADVTEASHVVLYRENEKGLFFPLAHFALREDVVMEPFGEEDQNIVAEMVRKWSPFVTSDESVLSSWGVPYLREDVVPRVFMAFPFKIGKDRAIVCLDSFNLASFGDKQQRWVKDFVELFRKFAHVECDISRSKIPSAVLRFLSKTIRFFAHSSLDEAFVRWCRVLGVDLGAVFSEQDDSFKLMSLYRRTDLPDDISVEVGTRSILRLAYEKGEIYTYKDEKAQFFPGYEAYGTVVPIRTHRFKGIVLLAAENGDLFSQEYAEVLRDAVYIISMASPAGGDHAVEPHEVGNRLKILATRASREERFLGVLLFTVKNIDKEYSKKGFWAVEELMHQVLHSAKSLQPPPELVARLSDNAVIVVDFFSTPEEAKEFKIKFNNATADVMDFRDCNTEIIVYPEEVSRQDDLLKVVSDKVIKSKKKAMLSL